MASPSVLTPAQISAVLSSCKLKADSALVNRVQGYVRSLERWNRRINLTAIQDPIEIMKVLLAESFFAAELIGNSNGPLLDIGSGAGFPGLAMAIYRPGLEAILLEPRKKRAAFLSALRRELGLSLVSVWDRRLDECVAADFARLPTLLTMRGVGPKTQLVEEGAQFLRGSRNVLLFSSLRAAEATMDGLSSVGWQSPRPVPWNPNHVILFGQVKDVPRETPT